MSHIPSAGRLPALGLAVAALVAGAGAAADVPLEEIGKVEVLETPLSHHTVWASDAVLARTALIDLDSGELLGVLDGGFGLTSPLFSKVRPEIYVPATYYSRGSRGVRTDVVTIFDAVTLAPVGEVVIPPKRAINPLPSANHALTDDDRFLAVFNFTPATSLTIVDLEARRVVAEVPTPGCSLAYGAGDRRVAMLCQNGALLLLTLDEEGAPASLDRSEPFFDPERDPVTEKAVRHGDTWLFVSFEGFVHPVDLSGPEPRFPERWSLLDDTDRAESWRIGGRQHLALHRRTNRLYSLVHQGGPDTHKEGGTELWIYDLERRARVRRIALRNPGFTYLGVSLEFGRDWVWPFHRLYDWITGLTRLGVGEIAVTQDDRPLLVTGSEFSGSLAIYDALDGEFLRRIAVGNMTNIILRAPWETVEATR